MQTDGTGILKVIDLLGTVIARLEEQGNALAQRVQALEESKEQEGVQE